MGSPSSLQMTLSQLDQENESDLPRAPLCPPSLPANSFCMSGHLPQHLLAVPFLHLGHPAPAAGWDTADHFLLSTPPTRLL